MARGNNGNYLQHSVELAAARRLMSQDGHLHLALCHGMSPYEPCDPPRRGQARRLLREALAQAEQSPRPGEAAIIGACRALSATLARYPNTGELVASITDRRRLSGGIAETDSAKHAALTAAWVGSRVVPVNASWRALVLDGALSCPASLDVPWLFSMDPMTYHRGEARDDNGLYAADGELIATALSRYASADAPGIATIFVYGIREQGPLLSLFWRFAEQLSERVRMTLHSCWVPHHGGNLNLGAVLQSRITLPDDWRPPGVCSGYSRWP
jgi:hypothetical protein